MLPILPILILLLLGPANAERLAAEGRLPAALLAVHLAQTVPMRVACVAPAEVPEGRPEGAPESEARPSAERAFWPSSWPSKSRNNPGCPARAGPQVA